MMGFCGADCVWGRFHPRQARQRPHLILITLTWTTWQHFKLYPGVQSCSDHIPFLSNSTSVFKTLSLPADIPLQRDLNKLKQR